MDKSRKQLSLVERWELDIESYKEGAKVNVSIPQCESCSYYIKGNALHCKKYQSDRKPKYVLFPCKECPEYCNNHKISIAITNETEDKFYGGLFGSCIGDMLGVPVEFSSRTERANDPVQELRAYGTYHQPFGTWSDDTSLTLCLIDAINGGFSLDKVARNFILFYEKACFTPHGEVFDIGNATRTAIEKMIHGIRPEECGGKKESDNGNGSLMRILPIAFYGNGANLGNEAFIELIENVSALTHGHKRSKLACIFYVVYVIQLLQGCEKIEAYDKTIEFIINNCTETYADELKNFNRIIKKECIMCNREQIRSTGYVVDTLEAVLWTFYNSDSYKETVINAVNLGGDTDTIAAIAGGLAGIYYGYTDIPAQWIQIISKKEEIKKLFSDFYRIIQMK